MTEAEDEAMDVVLDLRERLQAIDGIVVARREHGQDASGRRLEPAERRQLGPGGQNAQHVAERRGRRPDDVLVAGARAAAV